MKANGIRTLSLAAIDFCAAVGLVFGTIDHVAPVAFVVVAVFALQAARGAERAA